MIAGVACSFLIMILAINPLLARGLVRALRFPDNGPIADSGAQFWLVAGIPAIALVIGVGLFARATDESAPKAWKGKWQWMILFFAPLVWAMSLTGSRGRGLRPSELAARLDISYFQAEFLQATAEPVAFVFIASFLSMYAVSLASGDRFRLSGAPLGKPRPRPSRRLRTTVIAACYVVMATVFVLVGRSAGGGYW